MSYAISTSQCLNTLPLKIILIYHQLQRVMYSVYLQTSFNLYGTAEVFSKSIEILLILLAADSLEI